MKDGGRRKRRQTLTLALAMVMKGGDCELIVLVLRERERERVLSLLDQVPRVLVVAFKASRVSPPLPPH